MGMIFLYSLHTNGKLRPCNIQALNPKLHVLKLANASSGVLAASQMHKSRYPSIEVPQWYPFSILIRVWGLGQVPQ